MTDLDRLEADLPAAVHAAIWDYSHTRDWPIVGDDIVAAEYIAAHIQRNEELPWDDRPDLIAALREAETTLAAIREVVTTTLAAVSDPIADGMALEQIAAILDNTGEQP